MLDSIVAHVARFWHSLAADASQPAGGDAAVQAKLGALDALPTEVFHAVAALAGPQGRLALEGLAKGLVLPDPVWRPLATGAGVDTPGQLPVPASSWREAGLRHLASARSWDHRLAPSQYAYRRNLGRLRDGVLARDAQRALAYFPHVAAPRLLRLFEGLHRGKDGQNYVHVALPALLARQDVVHWARVTWTPDGYLLKLWDTEHRSRVDGSTHFVRAALAYAKKTWGAAVWRGEVRHFGRATFEVMTSRPSPAQGVTVWAVGRPSLWAAVGNTVNVNGPRASIDPLMGRELFALYGHALNLMAFACSIERNTYTYIGHPGAQSRSPIPGDVRAVFERHQAALLDLNGSPGGDAA